MVRQVTDEQLLRVIIKGICVGSGTRADRDLDGQTGVDAVLVVMIKGILVGAYCAPAKVHNPGT